MSFKSSSVTIFTALAFFLVLDARLAFGSDQKILRGHVPALARRLTTTGRLPATNQLRLALGLPLRDAAGLKSFLAQVYDPANPNFHRYLTPEEFTDRFGPTEGDYDTIKRFARASGLHVAATHGNRLLLDVTGSAAAVEKAFHVSLRSYRHPNENRDCFAPDTEPTVAATLPLADVSGLENFSRPQPKVRRLEATTLSAKTSVPKGAGSGPAFNGFATYLGADFRNAYAPGTTLDGTGQMVGLVQFDGFYSNDIVSYENLAGLPNVPVETVLLDGFDGSSSGGGIEVSLDIEMAISMAPGLAKVVVFEAGPTGIPNDVLNSMAESNLIKNLSCSWGWSGGPDATTENIFLQMAAQGQSFFNASGDSDAFPPGVVDDPNYNGSPSSSPNITQVGGTFLSMNGGGAAYDSEVVWNRSSGVGSSGGVSSYYSIPAWQQGLSSSLSNGGSATHRNIPDVAMTGDNVYVIHANGIGEPVGGTSCASPLWAGFMALVNQQAAAEGKPPVGFINPAIYELANSSTYNALFHDITVGDITWASSPDAFYAGPGYDLCTGLGSPTGTNLIHALLNPDPLVVISNSGFTAFGSPAATFSVAAQTFILTNAGPATLNWSLINTAAWLAVSSSNGTLGVAASSPVVVQLNTFASNLPPGTYSTGIWFSNVTSGMAHARFFTVSVNDQLVQNGGFETGDFTDWTLVGNTVAGGFIFNAVESAFTVPGVVHSGNDGAFLGDTQVATLSQTLATIPGQRYLISFWLDNPVSGTVQTFLVNWNTNSPANNQIYYLSHPPVLGWTNLTFVVAATSDNTVLQFGAENEPNFFGLDDITVTPIPLPSFTSVSQTTDGFNFIWNSLAGVTYQVQYKTNLLQTGWMDLGSPVTGTVGTTSFTNIFGPDPQRYYRVRQLP